MIRAERARRRAEALVQCALTDGLDGPALERLDALLVLRSTGKLTWLGWLRQL